MQFFDGLRAAPHKVLLLVRPGGFEPLAFQVGVLRPRGDRHPAGREGRRVQTFEQTKDSLKVFYARQKLRNTENDSVKSR